MKALIVALAAFAFWSGVGCTAPESASPPPASGGALPPPAELEEPDTAGAPAPPPAGDSGAGSAGGSVVETIKPDPSAAAEPTAITIPEGSGWTNPGVPLTQQQADVEACFSYADAQIKRETQIDDDRYSFDDDVDFQNQYGLNTFKQRVDYYSERRRRGALFDTCMESKGYVKE